jgi:hypothetical protein
LNLNLNQTIFFIDVHAFIYPPKVASADLEWAPVIVIGDMTHSMCQLARLLLNIDCQFDNVPRLLLKIDFKNTNSAHMLLKIDCRCVRCAHDSSLLGV